MAPAQALTTQNHKAATNQNAGQRHSAILTAKATEPVTTTPAVAIAQVQTFNNGCSEYRYLVEQYDWNVQIMLAVMQAESSCNPNAVNPVNYDGVGDYGLMQLHGQYVLDPAQNVAAAYRLWKVQGYTAWVAYSSGSYWKFM